MSDGPHRSLPMSRGWKKLAERADNAACVPEEIRDALLPALAHDWSSDIPHDFIQGIEAVSRDQPGLFRDDKLSRLESLRSLTAGHGLARLVLDCAMETAATNGDAGDLSLDAVSKALEIRAARGAHQVEEHYCRRSNAPRAQKVRSGIEDGIAIAPLKDLARQLLKRDSVPARRSAPKKRGLDEGVKL